jgi:hypothetical protein
MTERSKLGWIMAIMSLITSLLGSLASTPANSGSGGGAYSGGGMYSSYIPQKQQSNQSMLGSMLDFKGRMAEDKKSAGMDAMFWGGLGLSGKKKKAQEYEFDPYSVYSPQQLDSVYGLQNLASSGEGAGMSLGKAYAGDLGYYQQSQGELDALGGIQGLLNGSDINGARDVYSRMAENKFNPDDPTNGYASFSRALAKAGNESSDALNQEAAMTGSRFGTGIQKQKASLSADMQNQRGSYLADLYNQGEDRALQGASGLQGLIANQQSLFNNVNSLASVERQLKNQQAEDKYAEFVRQQNENYMRIGLMGDQWQNPMGKIKYTL